MFDVEQIDVHFTCVLMYYLLMIHIPPICKSSSINCNEWNHCNVCNKEVF